jgi:hypothetical protein
MASHDRRRSQTLRAIEKKAADGQRPALSLQSYFQNETPKARPPRRV